MAENLYALEMGNLIYKYYPKNVSANSLEYEKTEENHRLLHAIQISKSDNRWSEFINNVQSQIKNQFLDQSTYAISTPCFKAELAYDINGRSYLIFFYCSFIGDLYGFKIKNIFTDCQVEGKRVSDFSKEELQGFIERLKIKSDNHERYNPVSVNQYPEELSEVMLALISAQKQIFNYNLLPVDLVNTVMPDVSTNLKELGKATYFDCVFTDH